MLRLGEVVERPASIFQMPLSSRPDSFTGPMCLKKICDTVRAEYSAVRVFMDFRWEELSSGT